MRGSVNWQMNQIFTESGIFRPGESKHQDKEDARSVLEEKGQTGTSQAIASHTTIHSYDTARDYKDTWHTFGHFAREELKLKDFTRTEAHHIQAYLEKRIAEGISYGSWRKEAAHLGKLGNALTMYAEKQGIDRGYDFRSGINELRAVAQRELQSKDTIRGYMNPEKVISGISNPIFNLLAQIQLEGGARLHEVTLIRPEQLRGLGNDPQTGKPVGILHLTNTKGGKPRDIQLTPKTYNRLEKTLEKGVVKESQGSYRKAVVRAAQVTKERVQGTHDFRYCYARNRYMELTKTGKVPEVAHQIISREMGHERADITIHYLK